MQRYVSKHQTTKKINLQKFYILFPGVESNLQKFYTTFVVSYHSVVYTNNIIDKGVESSTKLILSFGIEKFFREKGYQSL